MKVSAIREKLSHLIENASDDKVMAMYLILKDDLKENNASEYSEEFKQELDRRWAAYKSGLSKTISSDESRRRVRAILEAVKQ